jgi:hypothetical protein
VLAVFDEMVAHAVQTFEGITVERLGEPSPEPTMNAVVFEDLINILSHVSTHTGQILFIAKMLRGGSIDELWMHSHRDSGAWKR